MNYIKLKRTCFLPSIISGRLVCTPKPLGWSWGWGEGAKLFQTAV